MDALHLVWGRPSVAADWLLTQQLAFLLADTCQDKTMETLEMDGH